MSTSRPSAATEVSTPASPAGSSDLSATHADAALNCEPGGVETIPRPSGPTATERGSGPTPSISTDSPRGPVALCLLALLGIGCIVRTTYFTEVGLHFDECCSWKISQFPIGEMIEAVSHDAHPPVYYGMMKLAGWLGAHDLASIRGISVAWGLGTILSASWFLWTAFGQMAQERALHAPPTAPHPLWPLLGSLLVATNPAQVDVSMQARPYAFGTCLALLSATFLLRSFAPAARTVDWCLFTVTAAMLSLTHYYGLLTVGALFLFALAEVVWESLEYGWNSRTRTLVMSILGSAWVFQLAWLPWWPTFAFQRARASDQLWMGPLTWNELTENCWHALVGPQPRGVPQGWEVLAICLWAIVPLGAAMLCGRAGRLVGLAASMPLVGILLYALMVRNVLGAKYLIFAQVFVLIGGLLLLSRWPQRWLRVPIAALAIALNGHGCWDYLKYRETLSTAPGIRGVSEFLEQNSRGGEPVIVGSPFVSVVLQHYFSRPEAVYVVYHRNHRSDLLGGPPLRESEYRDLDQRWRDAPDSVWTVDVYELFAPHSVFDVTAPPGWSMVEQQEFREVSGLKCVLAVRKFRRDV